MRQSKLIVILVLLTATVHYGWLLFHQGNSWLCRLENQRLKREVLKVRELSRELAALRAVERRLNQGLGVGIGLDREEPVPGRSQVFTGPGTGLPDGPGLPGLNPVEGVLTRGYVRESWPGSLDHPGVDLAAQAGSPVFATAGGFIMFSDWTRTWGFLVGVQHEDGISTWYGHLAGPMVKLGQRVARGEVVGRIAPAGEDGGAHLHYAVLRKGRPQDPLAYLDFHTQREKPE